MAKIISFKEKAIIPITEACVVNGNARREELSSSIMQIACLTGKTSPEILRKIKKYNERGLIPSHTFSIESVCMLIESEEKNLKERFNCIQGGLTKKPSRETKNRKNFHCYQSGSEIEK